MLLENPQSTQTFKASDGSNLRKVFMPVPYNIGFELNILVKLNDDATTNHRTDTYHIFNHHLI